MADFTEQVEDAELQEALVNALNRPKPFRNFKWIVENDGDYREKWFDYKRKRYIEHVEEQVEMNQEEFEWCLNH